MDQVEGGTLIINKGDEEKAKDSADDDPDARNINYVEGLAEGWKMAEVGSFRSSDWTTRLNLSPGQHRRAHQAYVQAGRPQ